MQILRQRLAWRYQELSCRQVYLYCLWRQGSLGWHEEVHWDVTQVHSQYRCNLRHWPPRNCWWKVSWWGGGQVGSRLMSTYVQRLRRLVCKLVHRLNHGSESENDWEFRARTFCTCDMSVYFVLLHTDVSFLIRLLCNIADLKTPFGGHAGYLALTSSHVLLMLSHVAHMQ